MEQRKIQTVGGGTYTVSLPKQWAESQNWTRGQMVNLHTHMDGVLVIEGVETEGERTRRIELDIETASPNKIEHSLRAAYAVGAKTIQVELAEKHVEAQRRAIDQVTRNLPGMTVNEASGQQVEIKVLIDAKEVSIRQSVRQLHFIAVSNYQDAMATLAGESSGTQWAEADKQVDRLHAMIDRYTGRGITHLDEMDALGLTRPELLTLRETAKELERIADLAERIGRAADHLTEPPEELVVELSGLAQDAQTVIEAAVSVVVRDAPVSVADEALERRDTIQAGILSVDVPEADSRLYHIADNISRTADHGGNIAELGLQMSLRDGTLSLGSDDIDVSPVKTETTE